jgi:ParB/RepB/Spo0J family partition protein
MKKPSHFARMTELVGLAVDNAKPAEERKPNEVVLENVISIDPAKTRMNDLHRRTSIDSQGLEELADQIREAGQLLPARGWRLETPEPDGTEVILIFGARGRAACQRLGLGLKVEIVPAPSRQGLIRQMHSENSSRKDYLPLEQGLEFKAFLETGEFKTQDELAAFLAVQRVRVVRCLRIADLPADVLASYADPQWLTLTVGTKLAAEVEKDVATRNRIVEAAKNWTAQGRGGDPSGALLSAAAGARSKARAVEQDLVSVGDKKTKFGRLKTTAEGALVLQLRRGAPGELRDELMGVLKRYAKGLK